MKSDILLRTLSTLDGGSGRFASVVAGRKQCSFVFNRSAPARWSRDEFFIRALLLYLDHGTVETAQQLGAEELVATKLWTAKTRQFPGSRV